MAFTRRDPYRWQKRHAYVVEECRTIGVRELVRALSPQQRVTLTYWHPPGRPALTIILRQMGAARRWSLRCPACGRRCDALLVPPDVSGEHWRCRRCWGGLPYASQRYGRRHPLRGVLTPRKRLSKAKVEARRAREEAIARQEFEERRRQAEREPQARADAQSRGREADRLRAAQLTKWRESARALLEADGEDNLEFLRAIKDGNLSPRSLQGRAARMLARAARVYGTQ